ncbi:MULTISPECIES: hypothetical protein, partial [Vibrio]|uniref:hypothetical protein n=1 Tax=Vibrio TaxID=662 RepID=UPI001CDBA618
RAGGSLQQRRMGVLMRMEIAQLLTWVILNDKKIPRNTFALVFVYPNELKGIGTTPKEKISRYG